MRASINLVIAAAMLGAFGCGQPYDFAQVEGKVTLAGRPLQGIRVWFYLEADGREQPPYASGTTDSSGVYHLTAETGKPGALVGKHRVVVNWAVPERNPNKRPSPPLRPLIPLRYTAADDTTIIVEVKSGPKQTINIEIPGS